MRKVLLAVTLALFVVACGSGYYYKVVDPASGKTYYTKKINEEKGGAVKLEDAASGSTVTLQNSEITKIDRTEFNENTKKE
ncbi:MAG: hypothetical protein PVG51_12705 [Desulfosarcina sp.]